MMPFVTFLKQLWHVCNDSYFLGWQPNILLLMLYNQFFFFCVFIHQYFAIMLLQLVPTDGIPGSGLPSFAIK